MINLLPPEIKGQIAFSKRNAALVRIIAAFVASSGILGALLVFGSKSLDAQVVSVQHDYDNQKKSSPDNGSITALQAVNRRLAIIQSLNNSKHHYSALLRSLSAAMPRGAYFSVIDLAGDDKPLKLSIQTTSYSIATKVKDALLKSKRVAGVDLESIAKADAGGGYTVAVTIALKPGASK